MLATLLHFFLIFSEVRVLQKYDVLLAHYILFQSFVTST
jgi:hypothetical protein